MEETSQPTVAREDRLPTSVDEERNVGIPTPPNELNPSEFVLFAGSGVSALTDDETWLGFVKWCIKSASGSALPPDLRPGLLDSANRMNPAQFKALFGAIRSLYETEDAGGVPGYYELFTESPLARLTPTAAHNTLVQAGFRTIITTNFDNGLAAASDANGRGYERIAPDEANQRLRDGVGIDRCIVHLHGTFSEPRSMVLTSDDYRRVYHDEQQLRDVLRHILGQCNIFFAGVGFGDEQVFEELAVKPKDALVRRIALLSSSEPCIALLRVLGFETKCYDLYDDPTREGGKHARFPRTLKIWCPQVAMEVA